MRAQKERTAILGVKFSNAERAEIREAARRAHSELRMGPWIRGLVLRELAAQKEQLRKVG